jgi:hypothetical protein
MLWFQLEANYSHNLLRIIHQNSWIFWNTSDDGRVEVWNHITTKFKCELYMNDENIIIIVIRFQIWYSSDVTGKNIRPRNKLNILGKRTKHQKGIIYYNNCQNFRKESAEELFSYFEFSDYCDFTGTKILLNNEL